MRLKPKSIKVHTRRFWGHRLNADLNNFFSDETSRLRALNKKIQDKNIALGGSTKGYILDVSIIRNDSTTAWGSHSKLTKINESLYSEALEYHTESMKLANTKSQISNLFSAAIIRCSEAQDYRDCVPDMLIDFSSDDIKKLPRTREPGYTLAHLGSATKRQFQSACDLLAYYQVNRLLY